MKPAELLREIETRGLLPMHDPRVVSATAMIAGEPIRGSWWADPRANQIYSVLTTVEEDEDVEVVKLLGKKLTFIHRRLWSDLYAVVTARDPWQVAGLDAELQTLERIEEAKRIRADAIRERKKDADRLAERLLVFATSVHTEGGRHERVYESWSSWKRRVKLAGESPPVDRAWAALEEAAVHYAPLALPHR